MSTILERCPNFNVDLAARIAELGRQPYTARAFIERWSDRVLFGTDMGPEPAWWSVYYRFLETADESFAYDADPEAAPSQGRWQIHGLHLPDDVAPPRLSRERAAPDSLLTNGSPVDTIPPIREPRRREQRARGSFVPADHGGDV